MPKSFDSEFEDIKKEYVIEIEGHRVRCIKYSDFPETVI